MKLVVAIDDRQSAQTSLQFIRRAKYAAGTEVHLVHALIPVFANAQVAGIPDVVAQDKAAADVVLSEMVVALKENPGLEATAEIVPGQTAEVIANVCRRTAADEVIVPTHARRGFNRLWFGSVADEIADVAPCTSIILAMPRG